MFDLKWLNDNLDLVRERTEWRHADVEFDRLAELLQSRRDIIFESETTRHEQRQAQDRMKSLDKRSDAFVELRTQLKDMSNRVKELEEQRRTVIEELESLALTIPNLTHESVPRGDGEDDNVVVRHWGEPREFDFEIADHVDIGQRLGIIDMDAGSKVARARFAFLLGAAARLSRTLVEFMLELHTKEHGYLELLPPFLVNRDSMTGTGQLPKFEEDAFQTDELFLIPTAEVPVTNMHRDEILDGERLPLRYVAYSPCFRREAGSHGKDTRGLIRQHQFEKVELVKFVAPEESYVEHDKLIADAERVLQLLELPYRVVSLCTADIGFSAAKCIDLEVWIPSQGRYREISSCSNFEAFQARRANIRFRREVQEKPEHVHTLNGSGLAIGRTLVAILENYQNADGSVTVPEVLRDRMGVERLVPRG